eukprot:5466424-Prymnesium_polylepis.4
MARLLAVGCDINLASVHSELDVIMAALPDGWTSLVRDVSADVAASQAASFPWFHWAGHADPVLGSRRTLVWVKAGRPEAIDAASLSLALAEALARVGVMNVVGYETLILDEPGKLFAEGFWRCLGAEVQAGRPLREAVRHGFEMVAVQSATVAGGSVITNAFGVSSTVLAATPKYAVGIDPEDAAHVAQPGGRCLAAAGADAEGRLAAGRWVLLQPQRSCGVLPAIPLPTAACARR